MTHRRATQQDEVETCEVGVVHGGPFRASWAAVKTVWRSWLFARKHGLPCNKWYGVYQAGTENILAACGPFPGAMKRAYAICTMLAERDK